MPETGILDLTAEDVTQTAWDELIRTMLNDEQAQFLGRSCNSNGGTTCGCSGSCGGTGCGGCGHLHP
jgi:hypothetical protein